MTHDQFLWGKVSIVMKQHGEQAPPKAAERIGTIAVAGDMAGVKLWKVIACRMDMMMRSRAQ
ncbi:DUF6961 family protein [Sphingobium aromaticiconvertens]|uniref:DUF6961 family protein n=1 Tax=Sphingobium aromaticiconvertens TaxID=365341 RepID=UPI003016EE58